MNPFKIYTIRCITNMHVGNGDVEYNIIDNQVQRDIITNFPTINSSSLKGSLRSFLQGKSIENSWSEDVVKVIFGDENVGIGMYKFFPAMLLSIPMRSNEKIFFRVTCPRIIKDFNSFVTDFNKESVLKSFIEIIESSPNGNIFISKKGEKFERQKLVRLEGIDIEILNQELDHKIYDQVIKLLGEDLIILNDETFSNMIEELPIIARNKLENGESKNLWYEEVVPRETRFYFATIEGGCDKSKENEKYCKAFKEIIDNTVQIGANATIGYGYCSINEVGDLFE